MNVDQAIRDLRAHIEPGRAAQMAAYHKIDRPYLGIANANTNACVAAWRVTLDVDGRVNLARKLWDTNIFETRLAAAKLLTQARIRPDDAVWSLISGWVAEFDSWAIADHAAMAGQKRLVADPSRIDEVAQWTRSDHLWSRRAALVFTLPWAKQNYPKPQELLVRDRVLGWAAEYAQDPDWFIQKAVGWWIRDLSKHDETRARAFLAEHGHKMKNFARKEASKYLKGLD